MSRLETAEAIYNTAAEALASAAANYQTAHTESLANLIIAQGYYDMYHIVTQPTETVRDTHN